MSPHGTYIVHEFLVVTIFTKNLASIMSEGMDNCVFINVESKFFAMQSCSSSDDAV